MSKENAVTLDLDAMFPGDGLDVEENVISDAYWALECEELAVLPTFTGTLMKRAARSSRNAATGILTTGG
jgi:hypothetical protein